MEHTLLHTIHTNPDTFFNLADKINNESIISARRREDGIELYSREPRTGISGQMVKLWGFISGRTHDRRLLVHQVMEDMVGKCRVHLGYQMSDAIQKRILSNTLDGDLTGLDLKALASDVRLSSAVLPKGPPLDRLPPRIQDMLVAETRECIGKYRTKISRNKLSAGHLRYIRHKISDGLSQAYSGVKRTLFENVFSPIRNFVARNNSPEAEPEQRPVPDLVNKEKKITEKLSEAWQKILRNEAFGQDFHQLRMNLLNSSGSHFQYDLLSAVVVRENFEDSVTMRRIFQNAFNQAVTKLAPDHENESQEIEFAGNVYNHARKQYAEGDCSVFFYQNKNQTGDPGIMVKSIDNPSADWHSIWNVNAKLANELAFYTSDEGFRNGGIDGLPHFKGTVRMQSGALGLVFAPHRNVSAQEVITLLQRMENAKLTKPDMADNLRTLIFRDLLTGLAFLQSRPLAAGAASFNLVDVNFGRDGVARGKWSGRANELSRFDGITNHKLEEMGSHPAAPLIEEREEEPLLSHQADEGGHAIAWRPDLHQDRPVPSANPAAQVILRLAASIFGSEVRRSNHHDALQDLVAGLRSGSLNTTNLLQHPLFDRIGRDTPTLRKELGRLIDKKSDHLAALAKLDEEARSKAEKAARKIPLKAIRDVSEDSLAVNVHKLQATKKANMLIRSLKLIGTVALPGVNKF